MICAIILNPRARRRREREMQLTTETDVQDSTVPVSAEATLTSTFDLEKGVREPPKDPPETAITAPMDELPPVVRVEHPRSDKPHPSTRILSQSPPSQTVDHSPSPIATLESESGNSAALDPTV